MKSLFQLARVSVYAFIVIAIGSYIIVAQESVTGEWRGNVSADSPGKIRLTFEQRSDESHRSSNSTKYDLNEIEGLNGDLRNGNVKFQIVRQAGTIECEGTFMDGKGSGTYRFNADPSFISAMQARGFDFLKTDNDSRQSSSQRLFTAALFDVTTALADDLNSANFPGLDVGDLFKAKIFRIDGNFIAEMKATGFPDLTMEDVVKARIFKIDPAYIRDMRNVISGTDKFENLVKYKIFKVTPEFLTELRDEGLSDLNSEEVVKLRIFKIDAEYVRNARAVDPNITVEQMVKKKIGIWGK